MIATPSPTSTPVTSISHYSLDLLNSKQLRLVTPDFKNLDWFTTVYQSRAQKKHPEYYSLRTLLKAVENSESSFKQFDLDERNLKKLAKSIFSENIWLQRDVTLAVMDYQFYIIGGRHRATAIATVFAQVVRGQYKSVVWSKEECQQAFETALEQNIRCEVIYLNSLEDLLMLITVDNDSRTMRKAEQSHLLAQAYGADSNSVESISKAVLGHDLSPSDAVGLAAQSFVRRPSSVLKPQTKQVIGEKVAKYILFGTKAEKKLSTKNHVQVQSLQEFEEKMDRSWQLLQELIKGQEVIAKDSSLIASQIIERLEAEEEAKAER